MGSNHKIDLPTANCTETDMLDKSSSDWSQHLVWVFFGSSLRDPSYLPNCRRNHCGIHRCTAAPWVTDVSQAISATFTYSRTSIQKNYSNKHRPVWKHIPTQLTMFYAAVAAVLAICAWAAFKPRRRKITAHPRDVIFSIASNDLEEYNNQSLQHFANPLGLEALSTMPTYEEVPWDPEDLDLGFSESNTITHQLLVNGACSDVKLKMKLAWLREDLAAPVLVVWQGREWIPLRYWLSYLAVTTETDLTGDEGYELQRRWWQANGLTFHFGELPHKARRKIALHVSR